MAPGRLASFIVEAPTSHSPVEWQHDEHMKATSNDIYGKCCLADLKSLNLESNFGVLDPENVGYLQPTSADTPLEIMHKRFQRDDYLFVKGCISKEASSIYREAYFNYMPPSGLLQEGSKPVDGVFSHKNSRKYLLPGNLRRQLGLKDDEESEKYLKLMISVHEAQFYLDSCANQELRDFISRFTGWEKPHLHQRTMLRAFVPDSELTPVHFDQIYLHAGPPTSLTAWVPTRDVSLEGGGLMYLEGSIDIGQQTETEFARNAQNLTDEERARI